jgi:hypothetical protein
MEGQDYLAFRLNPNYVISLPSMTDRFVLRYKQDASKPEQEPPPEGGNILKRAKSTKRQLLHDHRSSDALLEYIDNLEE